MFLLEFGERHGRIGFEQTRISGYQHRQSVTSAGSICGVTGKQYWLSKSILEPAHILNCSLILAGNNS